MDARALGFQKVLFVVHQLLPREDNRLHKFLDADGRTRTINWTRVDKNDTALSAFVDQLTGGVTKEIHASNAPLECGAFFPPADLLWQPHSSQPGISLWIGKARDATA